MLTPSLQQTREREAHLIRKVLRCLADVAVLVKNVFVKNAKKVASALCKKRERKHRETEQSQRTFNLKIRSIWLLHQISAETKDDIRLLRSEMLGKSTTLFLQVLQDQRHAPAIFKFQSFAEVSGGSRSSVAFSLWMRAQSASYFL